MAPREEIVGFARCRRWPRALGGAVSQPLPSVCCSPCPAGPAHRQRGASPQAGSVGRETMLPDSLQAPRKELRLGEAPERGTEAAARAGAEKPLLSPGGGCSPAAGQGLGQPEGGTTLCWEGAFLGSQPQPALGPWLALLGSLRHSSPGADPLQRRQRSSACGRSSWGHTPEPGLPAFPG